MKAFFDKLQEHWVVMVQIAVWVGSALSSFLLPPPLDYMGIDQGSYNPFIQFLTTLLIGFIFLPIRTRSVRIYTWFWWKIALGFVVGGIIGFLVYQSFKVTRSVEYPERSRNYKIIGNTLTRRAQKSLEQGEAASVEELIMDVGGDARKLWPIQEIRYNTILMLALYSLCQFLFTVGIITLLQAIDCQLKEEPIPAQDDPSLVETS